MVSLLEISLLGWIIEISQIAVVVSWLGWAGFNRGVKWEPVGYIPCLSRKYHVSHIINLISCHQEIPHTNPHARLHPSQLCLIHCDGWVFSSLLKIGEKKQQSSITHPNQIVYNPATPFLLSGKGPDLRPLCGCPSEALRERGAQPKRTKRTRPGSKRRGIGNVPDGSKKALPRKREKARGGGSGGGGGGRGRW